ncbi:hypothetical protein AAHC03_019356 [Spirometra sp. Aus1]
MLNSQALYQNASKLLCVVSSKKTGLKNAFYSLEGPKSKALFAFVSRCLLAQKQLLKGLRDTGTVDDKSLRHQKHTTDLTRPACSTCMLTVVAFDLSCCRKPFGHRRIALQILRKNTKLPHAASSLRKSIKRILKEETSVDETTMRLPVFVRINTLCTTMQKIIKRLAKSGVYTLVEYSTEGTSYRKFLKTVRRLKPNEFVRDFHFPDLLLAFGAGSDLHDCSLRTSNKVIIQDKASCIPAMVLLSSPCLRKAHRVTVLDACAAPGNKATLLIAGLSSGQSSKVIALDRDPKRFQHLCSNLRSCAEQGGHSLSVNGASVLEGVASEKNQLCEIDARCVDFLSLDPQDPAFADLTAILLDPSCSSSGLHSRRPELAQEGPPPKERITRLSNLQSKLLRHALSFPSVQLVVYSTCSVYEEENEAVVREQAANFSEEFRLLKIWQDQPTPELTSDSTQAPVIPRAPWKTRGLGDDMSCCVRANPEKDLTVGFFVACFKRRTHKPNAPTA